MDENERVAEFNPAAGNHVRFQSRLRHRQKASELIIPEKYRRQHSEGFSAFNPPGQSHILGKRLEVEAMRSNGDMFPVELTVSQIDTGRDRQFTAFIRDITARRTAEKEMQKFQTIADNAAYGVGLADRDKKVLYVNASFARMHGGTPEDFIGKPFACFFSDDQLPALERLEEKITGRVKYRARKFGTPP